MKNKFLCIIFVSLLLTCSILSVADAKTGFEKWSAENRLPKIYVDVDLILKELGYDYTTETVPEKLLIQILRSYELGAETKTSDGNLHYTITADSTPKSRNIVGSESVVALDEATLMEFKTSFSISSKSDYGVPIGWDGQVGKAAIVFGVWDYPGTGKDLEDLEDAHTEVTGHIANCGEYDYWHFVNNSDATYYYVWAWTTWACAEYSDVDVIWMGHGRTVNDVSCYLPYDAYWEIIWPIYYGFIEDRYYFAEDFASTTFYDYSALRMGIGDFCYGAGFNSTYINPGGELIHDRAFTGPVLPTTIDYSFVFLESMGDNWYSGAYDSADAVDLAISAAANKIFPDCSAFSYYSNGDPIYI
ncbi:MAG: hypothetical protein IAX22_01320 [Candidatus Bathyarchaeota archaeon]|nr:hypothetical protein [Thermoproteota archaeon]MDT8781272.1 hypothetical protein [Candidatus Bathyarchaeota archaeon]